MHDPPRASGQRNLLITGCYRSGTTLVEKVLNRHPGIAVASQPFPVLYALLKERFLASLKVTRRYPLGHLFLESDYSRDEFFAFLDRYQINSRDLIELSKRLDDYQRGVLTPEMRTACGELVSGTFWDLYDQFLAILERLFPRTGVAYRGSKEVLVEEYGPYFARRGMPVIVVVRDPRGMIASANFSERKSFTGADRPVLFSLRAWRKSIAIGTELASHGTGCLVRYGELAQQPAVVLERICDWLGVDRFDNDAWSGPLVDQYGRRWEGNSSFSAKQGIQTDSIAAWTKKLPRDVVEYIETVCMPEMRLLGYSPTICERFDPRVIERYRDPFAEIHAAFPADYSHDGTRVAQEIQRAGLLTGDLDAEAQRQWFICPRAYELLKSAWIQGEHADERARRGVRT